MCCLLLLIFMNLGRLLCVPLDRPVHLLSIHDGVDVISESLSLNLAWMTIPTPANMLPSSQVAWRHEGFGSTLVTATKLDPFLQSRAAGRSSTSQDGQKLSDVPTPLSSVSVIHQWLGADVSKPPEIVQLVDQHKMSTVKSQRKGSTVAVTTTLLPFTLQALMSRTREMGGTSVLYGDVTSVELEHSTRSPLPESEQTPAFHITDGLRSPSTPTDVHLVNKMDLYPTSSGSTSITDSGNKLTPVSDAKQITFEPIQVISQSSMGPTANASPRTEMEINLTVRSHLLNKVTIWKSSTVAELLITEHLKDSSTVSQSTTTSWPSSLVGQGSSSAEELSTAWFPTSMIQQLNASEETFPASVRPTLTTWSAKGSEDPFPIITNWPPNTSEKFSPSAGTEWNMGPPRLKEELSTEGPALATSQLPRVSNDGSSTDSPLTTTSHLLNRLTDTFSRALLPASTNSKQNSSEEDSSAGSSLLPSGYQTSSRDSPFTVTDWGTEVSTKETFSTTSSTPPSWLLSVEEEFSTVSLSTATNWPVNFSEDKISTSLLSSATVGLPDVSDAGNTSVSPSMAMRQRITSSEEFSTSSSPTASGSLEEYLSDTVPEFSPTWSSTATSWLPSRNKDQFSTSLPFTETSRPLSNNEVASWTLDTSHIPMSTELSTASPFSHTSQQLRTSQEFSTVSQSLPIYLQTRFSEDNTSTVLPSVSENGFSISSPSTVTDGHVLTQSQNFFTSSQLPSANLPLNSSEVGPPDSTSRDPFTSAEVPFTSLSSLAVSLKLGPPESHPLTTGVDAGSKPEFWSKQTPLQILQTTSSTGPFGSHLVQFTILSRNYTVLLSDRSSNVYRDLESLVRQSMDRILHTRYGDSFLETKILGFENGSIKVTTEAVFQRGASLPSGSDVVRTFVTHIYKDLLPDKLQIDADSVVCNGYSLSNLEPEKLLVEFTALSTGFGPSSGKPTFYQDLLQQMRHWVVQSIEERYPVQEFNIDRIRHIQGDVNIYGTALLNTSGLVNDVEVLNVLHSLVNHSVDLRSLKVNGAGVSLHVLPISFAITSQVYNSTLRDSRSPDYCSLGRALVEALQRTLGEEYGHFKQAVIKHFRRGSIITTSDLIFLNTPPSRRDVLNLFLRSAPKGNFAGMDIEVDSYSLNVGALLINGWRETRFSGDIWRLELISGGYVVKSVGKGARLQRPYKYAHFPGFGIAIILMCGLPLLLIPSMVYLCWKYELLTKWKKHCSLDEWNVEQGTVSFPIPLPEFGPQSYRRRSIDEDSSKP